MRVSLDHLLGCRLEQDLTTGGSSSYHSDDFKLENGMPDMRQSILTFQIDDCAHTIAF